jgi:membrane associated rhomboid family serine protease
MAQPRYRMSRSIIYGYFPTGVKWLLIVNTAIFVLWYLGGQTVQSMLGPLSLFPDYVVFHFPWYVWQLFTYMFLHGGIGHLLFNMLALWMFGLPLEQTWGTRRFLKYYFLCGIGAGICDVVVNMALGHHNTSTIGASGAIYGLLLAFGVLFPDTTVLMSFLFPIKAKYLVMIYAAVALLSALGSGNSGVSNVAHLGGMIFGLLYLKVPFPGTRLVSLPDFGGWYRQRKMQRAKKKFQVYMKKHDGRGPFVN